MLKAVQTFIEYLGHAIMAACLMGLIALAGISLLMGYAAMTNLQGG